MKLIIPFCIEKQLKKLNIKLAKFVVFFKKTNFGSKKIIEICAPFRNTKVYKVYLDSLHRSVVFYIESKGIIYPVYVGNKNDNIAKNITVEVVRKHCEHWQEKVLEDIRNKHYKIRHY